MYPFAQDFDFFDVAIKASSESLIAYNAIVIVTGVNKLPDRYLTDRVNRSSYRSSSPNAGVRT